MFALLSYLRYARSMHGLLARYAHWRYQRERALDWRMSQDATLQRCLKQSAKTVFWTLDHGLEPSMSIADYQSKVPLRTYEALYEDYARGVHPNYQGYSPAIAFGSLRLQVGLHQVYSKSFR